MGLFYLTPIFITYLLGFAVASVGWITIFTNYRERCNFLGQNIQAPPSNYALIQGFSYLHSFQSNTFSKSVKGYQMGSHTSDPNGNK